METFNRFVKKIFIIPTWVMAVLTIFSTASLIYVFSNNLNSSLIAYISYFLSAYTLITVSIFMVKNFPDIYLKTKQIIYNNPIGNRYFTDIEYRVRISLYISLSINIFYSLFKLISGVIYSSFWWGAISVYYIILSIIRFSLLLHIERKNMNIIDEWKKYKICGFLMLLLNLSLSGIIFQMVWQNKAYIYPEVVVIASATYTFYSVTVSIIDLVKYRKHKNPLVSAAKTIRFAAALVSLLNLETAMLYAFGDEQAKFTQIMMAATGTAVCITVLIMSFYMIYKANLMIKKR